MVSPVPILQIGSINKNEWIAWFDDADDYVKKELPVISQQSEGNIHIYAWVNKK